MKVFRKLSPNKGIALALGYFDGIHIGHKKIISELTKYASLKDIKSAVVTFDKNPANYFSSSVVPSIQTLQDRDEMLDRAGVDYIYELNFEELKNFEAYEYIKNVLVKNFEPSAIITGYNHTFGKNKTGNPETIRKYSEEFNYNCITVPEYKLNNKTKVSSSEIRKKIAKGEIKLANELLGRMFGVENVVIEGDKIARTLGYPTANMLWPAGLIKLPYGVYFAYVQIEEKKLPSIVSWGVKPTFKDTKQETLEAHIYNFDENLYGKKLKVYFVQKIREQIKFNSAGELVRRIGEDYLQFKNMIGKN